MYSSSEEEGYDCPLCMEELDIADRYFKPCPCGYKICRFCWHHIRENLNGRCPACRREYSDQHAEFKPISEDEFARIKREKKEKDRQQKDMDLANRRHLANMRVVQKNLVYIIGLHPKLATEAIIGSNDYFGQFGKIAKIVINKRQIAPTSHANGATSMQPSAAVYVTYIKKEDAAKAIHEVDGGVMEGRILRASYGTTKYCTYYLRNMTCPNPNCLYLHEPGEDADTISKEELATGKHRMRDQMSHDDSDDEEKEYHAGTSRSQYSSPSLSNQDFSPSTPTHNHHQHHHSHHHHSLHNKKSLVLLDDERSALPATASWGKNSTPSTPNTNNSFLPEPRALTPDTFGPPLSVAVAQQQQQQQKQQLSPSVLKRKLEKKKRKELLQKQRREEGEPASSSLSAVNSADRANITATSREEDEADDEEDEEEEEDNCYLSQDGLVSFVLGDAFKKVMCPQKHFQNDSHATDPEPIGVSGLYDSSDEESNNYNHNRNSGGNVPMTPMDDVMGLEKLCLDDHISPLEYLIQQQTSGDEAAGTMMGYTGTFNPFAHQLFASGASSMSPIGTSAMVGSPIGSISNNTGAAAPATAAASLFDSPVRKTSRFGFAQF